ncbi:MAG: RNA methyltransferase [Bacteroidetes bacterium]|nr:MAG: RNA methyltransferase [Bacteroidota bacterium]
MFEKIAYRESGGLCAILQPKLLELSDLKLSQNPVIVVLEGTEKPGNLGAILRTTDAAKIDAVILCDSALELHNPNAIRASLGSIFTQQIVSCESEKAIFFLKQAKIKIYAAALTATKFYHESNFAQATAIAMGSEAFGLSEKWLKNCDQAIKIPMRGKVDSMNLSVSTAILVFEAMRQRGFE